MIPVIRRIALPGGVLTPMVSPVYANNVLVGNVANGTNDDLQVYSADCAGVADATKYCVITAGFERNIPCVGQYPGAPPGFDPKIIGFYLLAPNNMTVVLIWN